MSRLLALLRHRCPVCLEGPVFHSLLGMHPKCPACGIKYERETGYFLNAMFFAYVIGFLLVAPLSLYLYIRGVSTPVFALIVGTTLIVLWPFIFRLSRVLWLHADQLMDPRTVTQENTAQDLTTREKSSVSESGD